uniref:Uncharacterized protein n=1 Tax=Panagrolaimus superbus TaxID=310955 RepID=A0A914YCR7_9BILA
MFSRLKGYANKKQLLGFITHEIGDTINFFVIDSLTEKFVTSLSYQSENTKELIDEIPALKNCFKALIIDLFKLKLNLTPYQVSYKFCEELREILKEQKIPNYFISEESYLFTSLLTAAKLEISFDDSVLLILPHKNVTPKHVRTSFDLTIGEFKFTPKGYQLIKQQDISSLNVKSTPEALRHQICGTKNAPQNVIVASFYGKKIPFKKIFKSSNNLIILEKGLEYYRQDFLIEKCKWLLDKTFIKYHILPVSVRNLHVFGYFGNDKNIVDILKIDVNEPLPITKTASFVKSMPQLHIIFKDRISQYGTQTELPTDCHGLEITVTIDEENFDDIDIPQMSLKNFEKLPLKLNFLLESKIPFIGFFDNSSVIGIYQEPKGYQFLKEWNGMYGTDCFISFDEKKPKYGQKAMEVMLTKNTFVVFDLLKIMSMPSNDIKIDKSWGFKITKDSKNPVLLQFDNFDGKIKEASPAFLMALFLKQHFKAIQEKTGEKPKEIAFWILKVRFNEEENERIKEGLKKACQYLKIDCSFVDTDGFDSDFIKSCLNSLL